MINEKEILSSYIENGEMFVRVCLGSTKNSVKPNGEQIAKEHYKMKEQTLSLSEFCKAIGEGRAFFAGNFVADEDGKVHYRKANFKKSSLLVMDIDKGDYSIGEVMAFLQKNDIAPNIIYKSFSYTDELPRFRIIWVIGEVADKELMTDISVLMYELLNKWNVSNKTNKNKKTPHIVKEKKDGDYDYYVEEDDKAGANIAQMWQGTNKEVILVHQDYVNVADFVNVFYSLTSKGHSNRITETLKDTCNIGAIGWIGSRKYTEISSNYYEPRGKISQYKIKDGIPVMESVDVWGFKNNLKKDVRKPKIEFTDEQYGNSETSLLYSRCKLMNELRSTGEHWIDDGGYKTKFKICTNLKFIKDGQEVMHDTICQHSDRDESAWDYTFDKISTAFPPVPCSEFCPYAASCKYGRSSIAFAAQKSSYKSEKVVTEHKIDELTLEEAQDKTEEIIRETMNIHEEYREIYQGWTYGNRKKYHHIGLDEYRDEQESIRRALKTLFYNLNESYKMYGVVPYKVDRFIDDYEELMVYISNLSEMPFSEKRNLIESIREMAARMIKNNTAKTEIEQKRYDLRNQMDVISVPVGGGKTRALINEIASNYQKLFTFEITHIPHVAYAAPSHMLAEQFENELMDEIKKKRISDKDMAKLNIVRLTPRPELPFARDEADVQNLEKLGLAVGEKMKKYIETYKKLLSSSTISSDKKDMIREFITDAVLYVENRKQARKANVLITTHAYIQKAFFSAFDNVDIVYFDEDICKTTVGNFSLSLSQIVEMKDNLEGYTYGDGYEFTDLIDICDYIIKSPKNKIITFDSEKYLSSQFKDSDGSIKVVDYISEDKALAMANYKRKDKIDYLKLCNIKSFIRCGEKVVFGTYNQINVGSKPLVMLSANPSSVDVIRKITGRDNVRVYEVGFIKQKGTVIQYPNIGACRGDLEDADYIDGIKKIIKRDNPGCTEIITYKNTKDMFPEYNTTLHMGATSGINKISGKDMAVIGTYHIPPIIVNLFAAMFSDEGTITDIELPKYRKVDYMGIEQKISTYNRGILRDYHLWYIYDEMIQAVGRARAVRQTATISIFCQLQNPQAKIYSDTINRKSKKKTDEEKEQKMMDSIDKIDTNELIDLDTIPAEY